MNAALATLLTIVTIVGAVTGVYFAYKAQVRETSRLRAQEIDKAVTDAEAPLQTRITELRDTHREVLAGVRDAARQEVNAAQAVIARRDQTIRDLTARVDQLEDELRRGRG